MNKAMANAAKPVAVAVICGEFAIIGSNASATLNPVEFDGIRIQTGLNSVHSVFALCSIPAKMI